MKHFASLAVIVVMLLGVGLAVLAQRPSETRSAPPGGKLRKPQLSDTVKANVYADNGSGGGKKVLSGGKGGMWEGGIRVPFLVRGPGIKENSWCHTRVVGYDLFPTFCDWAGIAPKALPQGIEGGSLAGLLSHEGRGEVKPVREEPIFHFPHYQGDTPHSAIMLGNFKLLHFYEDNRDLLFNLSEDLGERHDLAPSRPADVVRLRKRLETYLKDNQAQLPTLNPQYDSHAPAASMRANKDSNKRNKGKGTP
jgi:arylsulfatase A-like enzyme